MIGAGVEMATGACLTAIAACLHIPEESLPKDNQRVLVSNVLGQIAWLRNRYPFERSRILSEILTLRVRAGSREQQKSYGTTQSHRASFAPYHCGSFRLTGGRAELSRLETPFPFSSCVSCVKLTCPRSPRSP